MPRDGHLNHVLYIFSYLMQQHDNYMLVLDLTYPEIDIDSFKLEEIRWGCKGTLAKECTKGNWKKLFFVPLWMLILLVTT